MLTELQLVFESKGFLAILSLKLSVRLKTVLSNIIRLKRYWKTILNVFLIKVFSKMTKTFYLYDIFFAYI